jgi:hypothetical protein
MVMILARRPKTDREEIEGQIEWFRDLLELLEAGEVGDAADIVRAAIKLLERKIEL